MSDTSVQEQKELIDRAVNREGYPVQSWTEDEDGVRGQLGNFETIVDDEDIGLFEGDHGTVHAVVVGAKQYGNEHVAFYFVGEGVDNDCGTRVNLGEHVEGI